MPASNSAALYYVPEGYSTRGPRLMGINAASEGFLRGLARHGGHDALYAVSENASVLQPFQEVVSAETDRARTEWISTARMEKLSDPGTLFLPGPGLGEYAWMRRRLGPSSFSLCGICHNTATKAVLDAITDLHTAPVEPWDAVVCPSTAVKHMVMSVVEDHATYIQERFGCARPPRPQFPVIPLGVSTKDFRTHPGIGEAWRNKLGIKPNAVVVLYMGRLDPFNKAHPLPLFLAAAAAATQTQSKLQILMAGWFPSEELEAAYLAAARDLCPDVDYAVIDARDADARSAVWSIADIFISPADNIQESFGLTPVEAMAAGLPVIVSEWNGYRETVRNNLDGFLIPTRTPPAGSGEDLAQGYGGRTVSYGDYIGIASQATAVDVSKMSQAITLLANDAGLRMQMGASGKARAKANFDWSVIIPQYQQLWAGLDALRHSASRLPDGASAYPARPDPFRAYAGYVREHLTLKTVVCLGRSAPDLIDYQLESPLGSFMRNRILPIDELKRLLSYLEAEPRSLAGLFQWASDAEDYVLWRSVGWMLKYDFIRIQ